MDEHDVIVVGGGHAGCEAALASARMGCRVLLVTLDRRAVSRMSCNPSIGGIAKSQLVFELDGIGGELARNTDYTGIQFRTLNTRKGPAVQAHRAQCDKPAFSARMLGVLERTQGLDIVDAEVDEIVVRHGAAVGVRLRDGRECSARAVVVTTGTFLNGVMYIGKRAIPGGRIGEPPSVGLSASLKKLGFRLGRLKTGTPPRLRGDSIRYDAIERQDGFEPPPFFSIEVARAWRLFHVEQSGSGDVRSAGTFHVEHPVSTSQPLIPGSGQLPCYLTRTTPETHAIIRAHLGDSALYGGLITGTGVRYCPSIEDKVVKFPERECHHVFIEPEGRYVPEVYPNGTSNSLPEAVQLEMIHSIPGLERAVVLQWGYGIEYDFSGPTQLLHSLESKDIGSLFLAGQINGTTGYEEAAAQGFMAGVNAALKARGERPIILDRGEAYIGVMIDDLVTKGTDEPYRMFTSRAEHRLLLRQDNARFRMLPHARRIGIASAMDLVETERLQVDIATEKARLASTRCRGATLEELLRSPGTAYGDLPGARLDLDPAVMVQLEIDAKYGGYIARELQQVMRLRALDEQRIPSELDYMQLRALRHESREKLMRVRPESIGQAARIPGLTPADIAILSVHIKRTGALGSALKK